jgi:hypothetical protein
MVYEIVVAGEAMHLVRVALHEQEPREDPRGTMVTVAPRDHAELVSIVNRLHEVGLEIVQLRRLTPSVPEV